MASPNVNELKEEKDSRPFTPSSCESEDSFHSLGDEANNDAKDSDDFFGKESEDISESSSVADDSIKDNLNFNVENVFKHNFNDNSSDTNHENKFLDNTGVKNVLNDTNPTNFLNANDSSPEEYEVAADYIDEDILKDTELCLSEEDKLKKKAESQNCKEEGNVHFKNGKFEESISFYTSGLRMCPLAYPKDRAILYSNRAAAKTKLNLRKEAIKDCDKAIELDSDYLKAIVRRATLNEETDNLDEALKDFQHILDLEPTNQDALRAVTILPQKINDRNEKLKDEMLGKLKDLGNMFLRPFGLSTSNFKMQQDPNSGGYNINFNQNPNS